MEKLKLVSKLFFVISGIALTGCIGTDYLRFYTSHRPEMAWYHHVGYDTVWNAAVDTLDENGFVIVQSDRTRGYISTDKRERNERRIKVSIKIFAEESAILVKIKATGETLSKPDKPDKGWPYWVKAADDEILALEILDKIASKL